MTLILSNLDIVESEIGKNEWLDDIRSEGERMALTASVAPSVSYRGDEGMIRRLLSILLDNAVKYCDPGGDITAYKKSDACIGFRAVLK